MAKFSRFLHKVIRYEYWPWYCMFLPLLPIYFFGVIRTRKLLYFTATNPSIEMGGFFGEKKNEILELIPEKFKVKSIHIFGDLPENIAQILANHSIEFPLIAKPNVGERGYDVRKIQNITILQEYAMSHSDFLIQEFVQYPLELGILYCRYPNTSEGFITSITEKKFLTVTGDGETNVKNLLMSHARGKMYLEVIKADYPHRLNMVPHKDEDFVVHYIGNHAKGTQFLNGNAHISKALNNVFNEMSDTVEGVFYGRYDLKVPSYNDLIAGKNIKIFEMNGVSSEPGHIYDLSNVFSAYKALSNHWLIIIEIANQNIKKGVKVTPLKTFIYQVKNHFFN